MYSETLLTLMVLSFRLFVQIVCLPSTLPVHFADKLGHFFFSLQLDVVDYLYYSLHLSLQPKGK